MSSDPTPSDAARFAQDRWEEEGRRIAPSLDRVAGVVVLGDDPEAAAAVALGIGRVQSQRRRVAIGDLVGEVGPLQSLVTGDDPHGIVDSFLYGVSLNRIAHRIDGSGNLFILPSGSEPLVAEEIFRNERWGRLATGFRDVGALLLLVAPAGSAGVEALVAHLDGVVLAGGSTAVPAGSTVIALAEPPSIDVPELEPAFPAPAPVEAVTPALASPDAVTEERIAFAAAASDAEVAREVQHDAQANAPRGAERGETQADREAERTVRHEVEHGAEERVDDVPVEPAALAAADAQPRTSTPPAAARWVRRIAEAPPTAVNLRVIPSTARRADRPEPEPEAEWAPPRRARWPYALAAGVVAVVAAAALLTRDQGTGTDAGRRGATARAATAGVDSLAAGSEGADGGGGSSAISATTAAGTVATPAAPGAPGPSDVAAPPLISNPDDSAAAASYSVQIVAANTVDGARAKMRDVALGLPAAVISPMSLGADSTRWYRLTVGAFADRQAAIDYLVQVRTRRKLDLDTENVVRLPFALLLEPRVPRSIAKATAAGYVSRGLPAYALLQPDSSARVYAGAFETPEQAGLLADQLRTSGIPPVVAYRTGRGF